MFSTDLIAKKLFYELANVIFSFYSVYLIKESVYCKQNYPIGENIWILT